MKKELIVMIEDKLNKYMNNEINFLEIEKLMLEIEIGNLNTNISDILFHALIHYNCDKDIHNEDMSYEIQQKKEIFTLFNCLKSNDLSACKEIISFMSPKEIKNKSMNSFFKYLLITFLTLLLIGCSKKDVKVEYYTYKNIVEKAFPWSFTARLIGKNYKVTNTLTQIKGPYELILSFSSKKNLEVINIESINLKYKNNDKKILLKKLIIKDMIFSDYRKDYFMVISIDDLKINYRELELIIKFNFNKDSTKKYKIVKTFKKDYKEEIITFWDKILNAT